MHFFQKELFPARTEKQKLKTNLLRKFQYVNFVCNYINFKIFNPLKSFRFTIVVTYTKN